MRLTIQQKKKTKQQYNVQEKTCLSVSGEPRICIILELIRVAAGLSLCRTNYSYQPLSRTIDLCLIVTIQLCCIFSCVLFASILGRQFCFLFHCEASSWNRSHGMQFLRNSFFVSFFCWFDFLLGNVFPCFFLQIYVLFIERFGCVCSIVEFWAFFALNVNKKFESSSTVVYFLQLLWQVLPCQLVVFISKN